MIKNRLRIAEVAQKDWAGPREKLVWLFGGVPNPAVCSTVGQEHRAPHVPMGSVPALRAPEPLLPPPSAVVRNGRFWNDEWAHDPKVWAWAYAARPDQLAVRLADHLVAGADATWGLLSTERIAVIIESRYVGDPEPAEPTEETPGGGLFGRARSLTKGVQSLLDRPEEKPRRQVVSLWEASAGAIGRISAVPRGRGLSPAWFARVDFVDGSAFEFASKSACQDVETAHLNLSASQR
ncbi:hypothetical protein [Streptoalloteichus hindustanus]|uniref:Uncharacterized protein n=1 Tax=Streptoalloteichus hindustanus TaxID=2017 RepID=A0A1M5N8S8_STRHI|nr:hypothetical protein [Streptoalloteichus hindustanus]SHG85908.1 hypothetical protein SAMN05444320_11534 [Streptoalloteichus hindustanus]